MTKMPIAQRSRYHIFNTLRYTKLVDDMNVSTKRGNARTKVCNAQS